MRTGGFAGLSREWRAGTTDAPDIDWRPLVDACPWKTVKVSPPAPDRFVWRIEARGGKHHRRATIADRDLVGAWRDLVDHVRSAAKK